MEQLDGKSDMARTVQFDLENTINLLKEQTNAQEHALG